MATFYLRTRTGLASKKAGKRHALYISGTDRYADKTEVQFVVDKNLPSWANNADEFFAEADQNERSNGRSYRSIVFAIPNEAADKCLWAQTYAHTLLGHEHAYRLAVHIANDGHNPHAHLMFSERGKTNLQAAIYFGRKNAKNRVFSGSQSKQWLQGAKRQYLTQIRTICPNYTPPNKHEPKIGPALLGANANYETQRLERKDEVLRLRSDIQELTDVDNAIASHEISLLIPIQKRAPINGILNEAGFQPSSKIVISHLLPPHSLQPRKRYRHGN